jgi:anti-sigma-K factor RskA
VDRELTRAELDELVPLYAIDALDSDEREEVARCLDHDAAARAELESLREAASFLLPPDVPAPASLWVGIERSLGGGQATTTPPPVRTGTARPSRRDEGRQRRRFRTVVAGLAAAAVVMAALLGVEVLRQQHRIDDLAAEMHRNPMEQQAMAARVASDAHTITLADMQRGGGAGQIVMLPDGTGYLFGDKLPALGRDASYQLWVEVGQGDSARMISLGVLGRDPGIVPFRLTATPTMFEVTHEPASGSGSPGGAVVLRGDVT